MQLFHAYFLQAKTFSWKNKIVPASIEEYIIRKMTNKTYHCIPWGFLHVCTHA